MRISTRVLRPGDTDHEVLWSAVGALAIGLAWSAVHVRWPVTLDRCVFKAATSWPCLTCGGTRAVKALAAGHPIDAFWLNPLVALLAAGWGAYMAYGAGAAAGAWPRLGVALDARECTALRAGSVATALAAWIFLVAQGR